MISPFNFFLKNRSSYLKLFIVFSSIFFIFSACVKDNPRTAYNLPAGERKWVGKFFRDTMLDEGAIYTLLGSKPMTKFPIYYLTDEEKKEIYEQMTEEEKKNLYIIEDYDLQKNWDKWEKLGPHFSITKYLFFKKEDPEYPTKIASIYFVNIAATVKLLQENYHLFRGETGMDFEPAQAVSEMEKGSEFWDKTFDNAILVGLLYGFGQKNACGFYEKYKGAEPDESIKFYFSDDLPEGSVSITNFPIPIFASFSNGEDEVIEKYKKERAEIQKFYHKRDFLDLTLQKLTETVQ